MLVVQPEGTDAWVAMGDLETEDGADVVDHGLELPRREHDLAELHDSLLAW